MNVSIVPFDVYGRTYMSIKGFSGRRLSLPGWHTTSLEDLIPSAWDLSTNSCPAFLGSGPFALILNLFSTFFANCFLF